MHHVVLDSALSTRDEAPHPLCKPTSGITYDAMMAMLDLSQKALGDRVTAFIGPQASLRMEKFMTPEQLGQIIQFFTIKTDHFPPRYDFVGMYWKERFAGTVEYMTAAYEDAVFAYPEDRPFAILRFARSVHFDKPQSCLTSPETSSAPL